MTIKKHAAKPAKPAKKTPVASGAKVRAAKEPVAPAELTAGVEPAVKAVKAAAKAKPAAKKTTSAKAKPVAEAKAAAKVKPVAEKKAAAKAKPVAEKKAAAKAKPVAEKKAAAKKKPVAETEPAAEPDEELLAEVEAEEPADDQEFPAPPAKLERLQKILAQAGVASRRHAEELIEQGRVQVNGQVVTALGSKADAGRDHIRVDGKLLQGAERLRYFVLNKPKGYVTTVSDPEGRPTVMEFFEKTKERLYPVGRLDYLSEGLLLVTNDGELANQLTRAASGVEKTYLVKVAGQPSEAELEVLRGGVAIDHTKPGQGRVNTAPAHITQVRHGDNPWFEVVLIEGRNRELRKMFEEIGHFVEKIRRVGYGPLVLDQEPGNMRELDPEELKALRLTAEGKLKPRRQGIEKFLPKETGIAGARRPLRSAKPFARQDDRPARGSFAPRRDEGGAARGPKPAYGKPAYGKPAFSKPAFGKPAFDRPATGAKPEFSKPGFDKPAYGKPAYGKPAYGKPATGKPAFNRAPGGRFAPSSGEDRPRFERPATEGTAEPRRSFTPRPPAGRGERGPARPSSRPFGKSPNKPRWDRPASPARPPFAPRTERPATEGTEEPRRSFTPRPPAGRSERGPARPPSRPYTKSPDKPRWDRPASPARPSFAPRTERPATEGTEEPRRSFTPRPPAGRSERGPARPPSRPFGKSPNKPRWDRPASPPRSNSRPWTGEGRGSAPRPEPAAPRPTTPRPERLVIESAEEPRRQFTPRPEGRPEPRRQFTPRAEGRPVRRDEGGPARPPSRPYTKAPAKPWDKDRTSRPPRRESSAPSFRGKSSSPTGGTGKPAFKVRSKSGFGSGPRTGGAGKPAFRGKPGGRPSGKRPGSRPGGSSSKGKRG